MRARLLFFALTLAAALGLGACGGGVNTSFPAPAPTSLIQNVIVIMQENRTLDNMVQGFPGADILGSLGQAGVPADSLDDTIDFTQTPAAFKPIAAQMKARNFLGQPRSLEAPDY